MVEELEIALCHHSSDQELAAAIAELPAILVSVAYDGFGFIGMLEIVSEFLLHIGVVGLDFDIMEVGHKSALHKPRLDAWTRHNGYGVGAHNPLKVGGDVVTFDTADEFVFELPLDGNERLDESGVDDIVVVDLPGINEWMIMIKLQEAGAPGLITHYVAKHEKVFLVTVSAGVVKEGEMARAIELCQHRKRGTLGDRAAFDESRSGGFVVDITEEIVEPIGGIADTNGLEKIEEVARPFFLLSERVFKVIDGGGGIGIENGSARQPEVIVHTVGGILQLIAAEAPEPAAKSGPNPIGGHIIADEAPGIETPATPTF